MVRVVAESDGVCVRPLVRQVLDRETGESVTVALPCGSTRESRCPSCAKRARWLRMQQCREGWHLSDEPEPSAAGPADDAPRIGLTSAPPTLMPDSWQRAGG